MFTIIYTSGTTGTPKGVVLTHENLTAGVCSAVRAINILENDEQYLFVPLAHVLGREIEWAPIRIGCTTWFSEGIAKIKENLVEVRPTFMASVPRIYEKFYAGVQAALAQGSPGKRKLVKWALGVGAVASARRRAGQVAGTLAGAAPRDRRQAGLQQAARGWASIGAASWSRAARRWRPRSPSSSTRPAS